MLVLAIETSCDETAVALYHGERGLLGHLVYTQLASHQRFGGVVPELASRDHSAKLLPLLTELLAKLKLSIDNIDAIAYTQAPGLAGALLVGASFAKTLAYARNIPTIGVNHLEGHLMSAFLGDTTPGYPFLTLLVSGGHTQLIKVQEFGNYTLLGETLDDAAGEAFDKTAKLLGLPYPGGPELAKLATKGSATRFKFPRPMANKPGFDFSFSGLKTHVATCCKALELDSQTKADVACAFEIAVIDSLLTKTFKALQQHQLTELVIVGGVSANLRLRTDVQAQAKAHGYTVHYPPLEFCTDNAAMIALAGYQRLKRGEADKDWQIEVSARSPIAFLSA